MSDKTLCHMAWDYPMFFMSTNSIGYCCRTPKITIDENLLNEMGDDFWSNHPHFVKRRKDLLNGVKSEDCKKCWKLEDNGFKSSRSVASLKHFMPKYFSSITHSTPLNEYINIEGIELSNFTNVIEVVLNNTCDAKCTYCNEWYSTQWFAEKSRYNEVDSSFSQVIQERNSKIEESFWSWYKNKAIISTKRFGFIGGEPFIIDALYECFDKLIELYDNGPSLDFKPEIFVTSNLNTPPTYFKKFIDYIPLLEKHFNIIVQVSGENIEKDLEYIRYGVKWDRWKHNVEFLLANTNISLNFLPCLSLLSIPKFNLYLKYFLDLCKKYRFMKIYFNIVTYPYCQSPMIAPKEFSKYFDSCIESIIELIKKDPRNDRFITHSYKAFLDCLIQTQSSIAKNPSETDINDNSKEFYKFFYKLDQRRKTNILEIIPELTEFYMAGRVNLQNKLIYIDSI
jgi:hypothetical protein